MSALPRRRLPVARRITWPFLPPELRAEIERRCGARVVEEQPVEWGFTPGFASVLLCEDGTRHFVKAASTKAQRGSCASYRAEIAVLRSLHPSLPVPRLLWSIDAEWVVLSTEYAAGSAPSLASPSALGACLDALEQCATLTTPAPLKAPSASAEFAAWPSYWELVPARPHHAEAAGLAAGFAAHVTGDTLVHTDVRVDNLLLDAQGRALVLDWTWPVEGAAWLDTVTLLALAHAEGADADALLAERSLTRGVPAEAIDSWLAVQAGYLLKSALDPVPVSAPHLRGHQQATGEAFWEWLADRRGWS